jgi:hypothetical protein
MYCLYKANTHKEIEVASYVIQTVRVSNSEMETHRGWQRPLDYALLSEQDRSVVFFSKGGIHGDPLNKP